MSTAVNIYEDIYEDIHEDVHMCHPYAQEITHDRKQASFIQVTFPQYSNFITLVAASRRWISASLIDVALSCLDGLVAYTLLPARIAASLVREQHALRYVSRRKPALAMNLYRYKLISEPNLGSQEFTASPEVHREHPLLRCLRFSQ